MASLSGKTSLVNSRIKFLEGGHAERNSAIEKPKLGLKPSGVFGGQRSPPAPSTLVGRSPFFNNITDDDKTVVSSSTVAVSAKHTVGSKVGVEGLKSAIADVKQPSNTAGVKTDKVYYGKNGAFGANTAMGAAGANVSKAANGAVAAVGANVSKSANGAVAAVGANGSKAANGAVAAVGANGSKESNGAVTGANGVKASNPEVRKLVYSQYR